ncbi:MAG: YcxB family protein [Oscillospiraceae bacterium]|nr:YcxB family protein [Oscillospiraceae bacterium]
MNKTGKPILSRSYHIPLSMFDEAFIAFQKKFVYPQNILLTVVLLAIAGVYIHAAIKDNSQTFAYLLIVVCFALIIVRWYRTFKLRRAVHDALKGVEQDTYELSVYNEGLVVRMEEAVSECEKPEKSDENLSETPSAENPEKLESDGNGFQQLFPEEPAEKGSVEPTEIPFGSGLKILEYPEYFMAYIVKQNFYVIPKKDFSADEIEQLRTLFQKKTG